MNRSDRRRFPRYNMRVPIRFRAMKSGVDTAEHTAECTNISRNGLYFTTSKAIGLGTTLDLTLRMPVEISGIETMEARCMGHIVHWDVMGDGQYGCGVRIDKYIAPARQHIELKHFVAAVGV